MTLQTRLRAIKSRPGNNTCADCGRSNPSWASATFGSLICINCSGIHRSLGTQYSFVRSLTLDEFTDEELRIFEVSCNDRIRKFFDERRVSTDINVRYRSPAARELANALLKEAQIDGQFVGQIETVATPKISQEPLKISVKETVAPKAFLDLSSVKSTPAAPAPFLNLSDATVSKDIGYSSEGYTTSVHDDGLTSISYNPYPQKQFEVTKTEIAVEAAKDAASKAGEWLKIAWDRAREVVKDNTMSEKEKERLNRYNQRNNLDYSPYRDYE